MDDPFHGRPDKARIKANRGCCLPISALGLGSQLRIKDAAARTKDDMSFCLGPQRPKDAPHPEMLGLLGELEQGTLDALAKVAVSEKERIKGGANFPPAMLPENERSVLGDVEAEAQRSEGAFGTPVSDPSAFPTASSVHSSSASAPEVAVQYVMQSMKQAIYQVLQEMSLAAASDTPFASRVALPATPPADPPVRLEKVHW